MPKYLLIPWYAVGKPDEAEHAIDPETEPERLMAAVAEFAKATQRAALRASPPRAIKPIRAAEPKPRKKSARKSRRVIFANSQWRVTPRWLECPCPPFAYPIEMARVAETVTLSNGQTYYAWPLHMAEKEWVVRTMFLEAFEAALRWNARNGGQPVDEAMLTRSIDRGRSSHPYIHGAE